MKNVSEIIKEVENSLLRERMENLIAIDAPKIIIKKCEDAISSPLKVGGLSRKYKEVAKAKVLSHEIFNGTTNTYNKGKKQTVVVRFELENGIFYYDYYANKFGKPIEMTCTLKQQDL